MESIRTEFSRSTGEEERLVAAVVDARQSHRAPAAGAEAVVHERVGLLPGALQEEIVGSGVDGPEEFVSGGMELVGRA